MIVNHDIMLGPGVEGQVRVLRGAVGGVLEGDSVTTDTLSRGLGMRAFWNQACTPRCGWMDPGAKGSAVEGEGVGGDGGGGGIPAFQRGTFHTFLQRRWVRERPVLTGVAAAPGRRAAAILPACTRPLDHSCFLETALVTTGRLASRRLTGRHPLSPTPQHPSLVLSSAGARPCV